MSGLTIENVHYLPLGQSYWIPGTTTQVHRYNRHDNPADWIEVDETGLRYRKTVPEGQPLAPWKRLKR